MRIGIDLDNTIICYDEAFVKAARDWDLLPEMEINNKKSVKEYLLQNNKDEESWMRLQGHVYGKGIMAAQLYPGFAEFIRRCTQAQIPLFIVSHKTHYGHYDETKTNLHTAALNWMSAQGFFDPEGLGLSSHQVYFELTRSQKIQRIKELACTHFIDDLSEVLLDTEFPTSVKPYLFAPNKDQASEIHSLKVCKNWTELERHIFSC